MRKSLSIIFPGKAIAPESLAVLLIKVLAWAPPMNGKGKPMVTKGSNFYLKSLVVP
ncbi:MAG TPA: hypothetical protein GX519_01505 [Thermoanaerobacterales bacterium]|nr:hypothetical protein [Thermoanaerobacterales bacterium]